jgi:tRNA-modifying protein YgfZ
MSLRDLYIQHGAVLADDGIPLHFGDLKAEYQAGVSAAVLLDRSHEGRLILTGRDRFELLQRMSTNDLNNMLPGEGRPTVFTNANARILDRVMVYNRDNEALLIIAGPGRGGPLTNFLKRNIFFNDDVKVTNQTADSAHLSLHGPQADLIMQALFSGKADPSKYHGSAVEIAGIESFVARMKPTLSGSHWMIVAPTGNADTVWPAVMQVGADNGMIPAGSLIYNMLRVRSGVPGTGFELSPDYIPLEVGLWDEVSFSKGCYTGQEIIARMESRDRLARTIVRLLPEAQVEAPAEVFHVDKRAGMLTSSVVTPDGERYAIGVVRLAFAQPGLLLHAGKPGGVAVRVGELLGAQPPALVQQRDNP